MSGGDTVEIIKEEAFRKQMKKGLSGAYLFFGDEDYMKAYTVGAVRSAVCGEDSFALFNDMKIDVMDYSAGALLDAIMPMPMMTDKKLVTVNGLNVSALRAKELDELFEVLETLNEYDYNVVIISVPAGMIEEGNLPKYPSKTLQELSKYVTPVYFEPVSGAKLVSWVGKHFCHNGAEATPEVCSFLIEYAGRSMYTLANETEKLSYYALSHGRKNVTKEDVLNVSIAEISTDAFTLANAILDGKNEEAMRALAAMKFRRVEPVNLLGEVSGVICDLVAIKALAEENCTYQEIAAALSTKTKKMSEYKVKLYVQKAAGKNKQRLREILELCAAADMAMKNSQQGYEVIEKLICSI